MHELSQDVGELRQRCSEFHRRGRESFRESFRPRSWNFPASHGVCWKARPQTRRTAVARANRDAPGGSALAFSNSALVTIGAQMAAARTRFPFDMVLVVGDNIVGRQRDPPDVAAKFEQPFEPLLER